MAAYYNEHDPAAVAWLRQLIADGLIAPGDVDDRSITEVRPDDLHGYTQCHFFAGIGGWSYAARLAGWPDDRPLWTGSCPCQPFSAAGKQQGEADARHLWPEFRRLIAECRPAIAVGEQVASALGRDWLAGVRADLEDLGYAVGAADLCAASAGAPHIRQRLFWVADADGGFSRNRGLQPGGEHGQQSQDGGAVGGLADAGHSEWGTEHGPGEDGCHRQDSRWEETHGQPGARCSVRGAVARCSSGGVANAQHAKRGTEHATDDNPHRGNGPGGHGDLGGVGESFQSGLEKQRSVRATLPGQGQRISREAAVGTDASTGVWDAFDLLPCLDGKTRRTQSGLFPLVDGLPRGVGPSGDPRRPIAPDEANATAEARVNRLRGYGNAIVPQVAALFLRAYLEAR